MARKGVVKEFKEMPKALKFVYYYNMFRVVFLVLAGIIFALTGMALSGVALPVFVSGLFLFFPIFFFVLAFLVWRFLTHDLKRGKVCSFWLNLILILYSLFVSIMDLAESINVLLIFEGIALYCLLRKDSRDFFKSRNKK